MKKVIIGIGLPGSGKTTVLKPFARDNRYTYISSDEIRAEMTGDPSDQSKNKEVWGEIYKRTSGAIDKEEDVVIDATFARQDQRRHFLQFVRDCGAERVQGVFFLIAFDIANERNTSRARVVPKDIMEIIHSDLETNPPTAEDGFDDLSTVSDFLKSNGVC